jgi:hypothetical protein
VYINDEIEKIRLDLEGLKKLQKKVGLQITECMEGISKFERYLRISGLKKS